ncbi:MAG: hypothetical protein WDO19_06160 [Bacteroidota bacterium]
MNFIQLISTPIVINLLNKRNSAGWMLSAGGKTTELAYTLCFWLGYWGNYSYVNAVTKIIIFLHILLLIGILVCLHYRQTRQIFQIAKSQQWQTILIGAAVGISYYFILTKIYHT